MHRELSTDEEKAVIDKAANFVVKNGFGEPAAILLEVYKPLFWIGGNYALVLIEPFLPFYEDVGHQLIQTLGKIENVSILIDRIKQLMDEKETEESRKKSLQQSPGRIEKIMSHLTMLKENLFKRLK